MTRKISAVEAALLNNEPTWNQYTSIEQPVYLLLTNPRLENNGMFMF
jgi:hypothetical protein